jgi:hypothetical protein
MTDCLSHVMRNAGHSLDGGCNICDLNCTYAAPCGCGGETCIDNVLGAPRATAWAAA